MVDRVIERTETPAPRETIVVHDREAPPQEHQSHTGLAIGVIIILLLLMLFLGRGMLGNGTSSNTPAHITTPSAGSAP